MARPRRSEHTREALIEAGIQQLAQFGYHGTGIKQILDEVKVPKGSFYNYFESKEAFVAEIIREYANNVLGELVEFTQSTRDAISPLGQIRAIYGYLMAKYEAVAYRHTCLIGSIAAEIGGQSELCQQAMSQSVNLWCEHIAQIVAAAQQDKQIRDDIPADQLSALIWSTWEGSLLRMKLEGNSNSGRTTLSLLLEQLLKP